jgi:hypothetical protein
VDVAFDSSRYHFGIAMVFVGEINQSRNQQWLVLHQTQHDVSFLIFRTIVLFYIVPILWHLSG